MTKFFHTFPSAEEERCPECSVRRVFKRALLSEVYEKAGMSLAETGGVQP
jgi:hypothetical protein